METPSVLNHLRQSVEAAAHANALRQVTPADLAQALATLAEVEAAFAAYRAQHGRNA